MISAEPDIKAAQERADAAGTNHWIIYETTGAAGQQGALNFYDGVNTTSRIIIDTNGNIGIGTTPNANAILDVASTTKAFMPPRMTTTQRGAISSPTAGMVIYNSTTNKLNVYTTAWEAVTSV